MMSLILEMARSVRYMRTTQKKEGGRISKHRIKYQRSRIKNQDTIYSVGTQKRKKRNQEIKRGQIDEHPTDHRRSTQTHTPSPFSFLLSLLHRKAVCCLLSTSSPTGWLAQCSKCARLVPGRVQSTKTRPLQVPFQ